MLRLELTPKHPVNDLAELDAQTEREGYDSCFISYHYNSHDLFAALVRLTAETDDVRLGPSVANSHELHPVTLAGRVATVVEALGSRGLLGTGPDDPSTLRNLGLENECGLRSVLEAFEVAQRLWDGKRVSYGGMLEVIDASLNFDVSGKVPVYVGGGGLHICRMAGKHADGLPSNDSHPDDLAWARKRVDISVEDRPDSHGEFTFATYASISVSEDADAIREAAQPPVASIIAGVAPPVLNRHGIGADRASNIDKEISTGNFSEAFGFVAPAMIDAFSMAGTPDNVADRMGVVLEHVGGIVIKSPVGPNLEEAITLAAATYRSMNRHQ